MRGSCTSWAGLPAGLAAFAVAIFFISATYTKWFWIVVFLAICLDSLVRRAEVERRGLARVALVRPSDQPVAMPQPGRGNVS